MISILFITFHDRACPLVTVTQRFRQKDDVTAKGGSALVSSLAPPSAAYLLCRDRVWCPASPPRPRNCRCLHTDGPSGSSQRRWTLNTTRAHNMRTRFVCSVLAPCCADRPLLSPLNFLSSRRSWSSNSRSNCICSIWASIRSLVVSHTSSTSRRSGAGLRAKREGSVVRSGLFGGKIKSVSTHCVSGGRPPSSSSSCLASCSLITSVREQDGAAGAADPHGL